MGPDFQDIYDTLKTKIDGYFVTEVNAEYEKYLFRNTQQKGETLDQFCTRLRK